MRSHRGLTLIEVLTATVLMAILVGTCVPILRQASRAMYLPVRPFEIRELATLADQFVADPATFGLEEALPEQPFELNWPETVPDRPPVLVSRLHGEDAEDGHEWLVFSCAHVTVVRWLPPVDPGDVPGGD